MGNKEKQNKKRFFYPPEFEKILDYLNKNGRFTAEFMINTGARINECRGFVNNSDPLFDKDRKNITLTQTKVRARLGEKHPEPRTIPLSDKYYKQLKEDIGKRRILSTNALNIALREACVEAGITNSEQFSSHNIRKTFATWMLSLGVDGFRLAKHLGHTPSELAKDYATNDVFNHSDKQIMRSIFGNLPGRIDQRLGENR
jgi:integrase